MSDTISFIAPEQTYPRSKQEILQDCGEKFIVKFSAERCPPCNALHAFINGPNFRANEKIQFYNIKVRDPDQEDICTELRKNLTFNRVPHCVVMDKNFTELDTFAGFSGATSFEEFLGKHFKYGNK